MSVLKGSSSFYQYQASDYLEHNLKEFFQYGLTELGAYTNFTFHSGSGRCTLKPYSATIYEGLGGSWVWEDDLVVPSGYDEPIRCSGVYIGNTFYPTSTTSGTYAHNIDFANGRIIFNSAIPTNSVVKAEYSIRDVAIYLDDSPQWRAIVDNYLNRFDSMVSGSGLSILLKENRVWLPCVIIQVNGRGNNRGLQLGGGDISECSVHYHVFSDKPFSRNTICDIINDQYYKVLNLYDVEAAPFPLNNDGTLASGALTYKELVTNYFYRDAHIKSSEGGAKGGRGGLYFGNIKQGIDIERHSG